MPSRDPATGKRISGAAQRRRKAAKLGLAAQVPTPKPDKATPTPTSRALVRKPAAKPADPPQPTPAPQGLPIPPDFLLVGAPPTEAHDIEKWAAGLNLRCVLATQTATSDEMPRCLFLMQVIRDLGRMKDKAAKAEKGLLLRRLRLGIAWEYDAQQPPYDDPLAALVWAYRTLAGMAFQACTDPSWQADPRLFSAAKMCAGAGFLPNNKEIDDIISRVKQAA